MFNRYWRSYPGFLQVVLFLLMFFTFYSFATLMAIAIVPKLTGVSVDAIIAITPASPVRVIRAAMFTQLIQHTLSFAVPALLFAYLTTPRPAEYLGLRQPGKPAHFLLVTLAMVGLLFPMIAGETWLSQHWKLGKWATDMETPRQNTFAAFLSVKNTADRMLMFLFSAVMVPLGEELIFRGVLFRFAQKRRRSLSSSVILVGFLFALSHFSPFGFPFIFIAGMILTLVYWLTGSVLCSMIGHFVFNGSQVVLIYLMSDSPEKQALAEGKGIPAGLIFGGLLLFAVSFYQLYRTRTPLPPNWSDDYLPGERPETLLPPDPPTT